MDCSLPCPSVHGIFQARILEWVAISSSRRSSPPRDRTQVSHVAGRRFPIWATREALVSCNLFDPLYSDFSPWVFTATSTKGEKGEEWCLPLMKTRTDPSSCWTWPQRQEESLPANVPISWMTLKGEENGFQAAKSSVHTHFMEIRPSY